jgi:hypothetical protein
MAVVDAFSIGAERPQGYDQGVIGGVHYIIVHTVRFGVPDGSREFIVFG